MVGFTGWKRTAIYLTALVAFLTVFLTVVLMVSVFALYREPESSFDDADTDRRQVDSLGQSRLFRGRCDTASKANLWIHLVINIIGTCILASSNFFMQSLMAPTRQEVDKAHAAGQWVEIGVQSPRNCRFVSWRKTTFWFLFGLTSIPFHLIFNGCVLESKASNGFNLVVAAEPFLHGAWDGLLPIEYWGDNFYHNKTLIKINESLSARDVSKNWEKIYVQDCIRRYNNTRSALTKYRHVVMVISNPDEETTRGWSRSQVLKHPNDTIFDVPINATKQEIEAINPLWSINSYHRDGTGNDGCQPIEQPLLNPRPNVLDEKTGEYRFNEKVYRPAYQTMQVRYCLSEKYEAPCRLSIANSLLLSVCIIKGSRSGHDPQNDDVIGLGLDLLPLLGMTVVANLPQLILSLCYMVYNSLFTRMLAEFEWFNYSVRFRALRVTDPRGQQNSTYRLQLPYRWSVPLLTVSTLLHWVYSNCIYVSNYDGKNLRLFEIR
ncbi:hypothetical protein CDV31_015843 [Fusarium ambrosium]|uniref:DUF6536 domain-containing protein n=1 Tax=Fusarium ambrosium TaxID=131363 RepID=A0A428SIP4_9HYPO|nr:hypothetical protein CDV31_015843 [Fusarium ambrosium]